MPIREFLSELRQEASHLSSKSLSPIGFGYRGRTRLERLLFLILKEYCEVRLAYDLGGLTHNHQRSFVEFTKVSSWDSEDIDMVKEGFRIAELVWQLSSGDPYVREDAMEELGGTVHVLFKNLADRIMKFVSRVEKRFLKFSS